METIRFIIAAILIVLGLIFHIASMFGMYKYKYVLNRMQAGAMGDTLGIALCLLGLVVLNGFSLGSLKFLLVIVFLWVASPVSSHLIARLEVTSNEDEEKPWKEYQG